MEGLVDVTKISPEEAIMECTISAGEPQSEIKWFKDGKQISAGKKYDMTYKDKHAVLKVKDSQVQDAGKYRCEASNIIGSVDTSATLTIHREYTATIV